MSDEFKPMKPTRPNHDVLIGALLCAATGLGFVGFVLWLVLR